MKEIKIYVADDGKEFSDAKACAKHEIETLPELKQKLFNGLEALPYLYAKRWCDSGACACMGCANHTVYELDLTQAHWQVWCDMNPIVTMKDKFKKLDFENVFDEIISARFFIHGMDSNNKLAVYKALQTYLSMTIHELFACFDKQEQCFELTHSAGVLRLAKIEVENLGLEVEVKPPKEVVEKDEIEPILIKKHKF